MRCETIGTNLVQKHVEEKVRMLDAFIDLLEHIEDHPVSRYEFGDDAAGEALGLRSFAGYLACELEELRKGYGSGGTAPLSGDVMPIAMHFVSTMAKNHMRDNPRR
jgi:hypothetical protein